MSPSIKAPKTSHPASDKPSGRSEASSSGKRKRKNRAGMSTKTIDIDKVHRKLLNVLARETNHLLAMSYARPLDKNESTALSSYLKLVIGLKKDGVEDLENMSEAELEKLVGK